MGDSYQDVSASNEDVSSIALPVPTVTTMD